jgi:KDO transferase-3
MQIAYHLGFRRLFLLGMDLGGAGAAIRFYEDSASGRPSMLDQDYWRYILPSFQVLSASREKLGLTVYNLSPSSRLPESVIPKVSLDEALRLATLARAA